jgi:trypsin-like peptidase
MRMSTALVAVLLAVLAACARQPPPTAQPGVRGPAEKTAGVVSPDPRIGALFLGAGDLHTCTAGVLDSKAGDLIITAAHCVAEGIDTTFVAGFKDAAEPGHIWKVAATYLDPRWVKDTDPQADFAILRVARDDGGSVEADAGGGLTLGTTPKPGTVVHVTGYALGQGGGPVGCEGSTGLTPAGYPSLPCDGLVDGTSGAPWTMGLTITGLVGGLNGGGCDENISYSPPFDDAVAELLTRAEAGGPADPAPTMFDSDC